MWNFEEPRIPSFTATINAPNLEKTANSSSSLLKLVIPSFKKTSLINFNQTTDLFLSILISKFVFMLSVDDTVIKNDSAVKIENCS